MKDGTVADIVLAASFNNLLAIKQALQDGVDVNTGDESGYTALHGSARRKPVDAMKLLLEAGADGNVQNSSVKATPLHAAVLHNNMDAVKMLLSVGADTSLETIDQMTPAQYASGEIADYLQLLADGKASRPTPESVELDMENRQASLDALDPGKRKFREIEATRQEQRQAALERGEGI